MAAPSELFPAFRQDDIILFQGDSITDGNRGRNDDPNHILGHGYVFIIAAKAAATVPGRGLAFLNRGVGGDKVRDLAARNEPDVLRLRPTLLSILAGINDALAGTPLAEWRRAYEKLVSDTLAALPGLRLVLGEPFALPTAVPSADRQAWEADVKARRAFVATLCSRYRLPLVRYQTAFDEACERAPAAHWIWDGIHPTYAGHQVMADEWLRTVATAWPASAD